ncbi:MAG TPA: asparagine synthase (glutamine-hydrolyzing) [Candidatus Merdibacter merdavium]|uniref:asparagine synthase (glutamine-hydrolyzing) n=1 Tax=Candidatus Merdibacter merdavium TaxID=2838692 RepID=A0A9D2SU71_9FIRM|nr:asparagine synthase (glutamine-hydrolyzing) [Candidatus Merdibacter merdavium]
MCGIAGIVDYEKERQTMGWESLKAMQDTMRRRGPDQKGIWRSRFVALVHARLSIIDPDHGLQPMHMKESCIVYNGELYNADELRKELQAAGFSFRTSCDTEVVLAAYLQWHEHCVERFNGIFAFALWDDWRKELFIARDPMGVKPLFYTWHETTFLFGSEIKTLLAHPLVEPRVRREGLLQLMLLGPGRIPGDGVFADIQELRPGCCGFVDVYGLHSWEYAPLKDRHHEQDLETTVGVVRELLLDAIHRQLQADVPVGTFLSGGLDSSIISAVAAKAFASQGKVLHTFSLDYEDNEKYFHSTKFQPDADTKYMQLMADQLHSEHHLIILKPEDVAQALYEAVEARDLPGMADVDSSLLLFCRQIRRHVKVALSGECADELFGGYPWFRDPQVRSRYGFPWAQTTAYRSTFIRPEILQGQDADAYVSSWYQKSIDATDCVADIDPGERRMREMVRLNMKWFMQTLLDRKDRMSMHESLEVRVPFCDVRLASYLYSIPWEMKDYRGYEKGLLREAVKGLLPDAVLWRKKSPYPKTWHPRYRACVSAMMREVLADAKAPLFEVVRKERVEQLLEEERSIPWYGQLMTTPQTIAYLLQLDHWLRHYHVQII